VGATQRTCNILDRMQDAANKSRDAGESAVKAYRRTIEHELFNDPIEMQTFHELEKEPEDKQAQQEVEGYVRDYRPVMTSAGWG